MASAMIQNLGEHRFRRDVERIVGVGPANVAVVIEAIGEELDCLDEVWKIIPDPGGDLQRSSPPGAA